MSEQVSLIPEVRPEYEDELVMLGDIDESPIRASEDLLKSMKNHGLMEPVILRENKDGGFTIIDGRRRVDAARRLKMDAIPARIVINASDTFNAVATIAAHATRHENPITEFEAIESLLNSNASIDDICKATGLKKQTVTMRLRLQNLVPDLRKAFLNGDMKPSVADKAARLSKERQQSLAKIFSDNGKIKLEDVKNIRQASTSENTEQMPSSIFGSTGEESMKVDPVEILRKIASEHPVIRASYKHELAALGIVKA